MMKTERILIALYTDDDGRQIVGGAGVDGGRDWLDVFGDMLRAIRENDYNVIDLSRVPSSGGRDS